MGKAFGRLVLIALVVFGLWYVFSHYRGAANFGCNVAAGDVAHAATGGCPDSVAQADSNAQWAGTRIDTIKDERVTTGLFYDEDGHEHKYDSSQNSDSDTALQVGRQLGVFPKVGRPSVVDHVEVKVAAVMRSTGVTTGVLVINNPAGPCARAGISVEPMSCLASMPRVLPPAATLVVWWRQSDGGLKNQIFRGGQ